MKERVIKVRKSFSSVESIPISTAKEAHNPFFRSTVSERPVVLLESEEEDRAVKPRQAI